MYRFIRRLFFFFPAEGVHYFAMNSLKLMNHERIIDYRLGSAESASALYVFET